MGGIGKEADTRVILAVEDNGRGMTPEVERRIFEPFFTTKALGRGLGLAAVSGIVRSHGGELRVASRPGGGTVMAIVFPAAAPGPAQRPSGRLRAAAIAAESAAASPETDGFVRGETTVLLVDDSDNFRRMCASLLVDLGYRTVDASTGQAAVSLLEADPSGIDVVVLDWTMPDPGGAATFRRLRSIRGDLRVIIMSGYAEGGATEMLREGAAGFLEKPFTAEVLDAVLRDVLIQGRTTSS